MAKIDKLLCPVCIFTARYVDLILNEDGLYICPYCNARFTYEEIMQVFSLSQYNLDIDKAFPESGIR